MILRSSPIIESTPAGAPQEDGMIVNLWSFGRQKTESESSHDAACQAPKLRG
jgi:hypothetical protein